MPIRLLRLPSVALAPEPSNSAIARSGLGSKEEESKDPTRPEAGSVNASVGVWKIPYGSSHRVELRSFPNGPSPRVQ